MKKRILKLTIIFSLIMIAAINVRVNYISAGGIELSGKAKTIKVKKTGYIKVKTKQYALGVNLYNKKGKKLTYMDCEGEHTVYFLVKKGTYKVKPVYLADNKT
ncbi:MAG: hypothetical protein K2N51_20170, partial [Lachnospiraceae bacterium]|nr:hypothetical protein [Lachnospiraceae bacterium]